jgi:hypothetical protein
MNSVRIIDWRKDLIMEFMKKKAKIYLKGTFSFFYANYELVLPVSFFPLPTSFS